MFSTRSPKKGNKKKNKKKFLFSRNIEASRGLTKKKQCSKLMCVTEKATCSGEVSGKNTE